MDNIFKSISEMAFQNTSFTVTILTGAHEKLERVSNILDFEVHPVLKTLKLEQCTYLKIQVP